MIFQMDFEISKEDKNNQNYENEIYNKFCAHYINQIRNKLNFEKENLTIDDPRIKKENDKDIKKIDIVRFKMDMISVRSHVDKHQFNKKKPKSTFNNNKIKEG